MSASPRATPATAETASASPGLVPGRGYGTAHLYRRFAGHPGDRITLRVTAADAAGGQISETITRAYGIAR